MSIKLASSALVLLSAVACTVAPVPSDLPRVEGTGGTPQPGTGGGGNGGDTGNGGTTPGNGGTTPGNGGTTPGNGGNVGTGGATPEPPPGDWQNVTANLAGLHSECGNMSFATNKPDRDMLIAGIARLGLWSSTDGGTAWEQLGQGKGSAEITNRMTSVVYDPDNANRYWESGIYNGGGVYVTEDNGATFKQLGDVHHNDVVSVDLTDPERKVLVVGGHESAQAVWRSGDSGATWETIGAGLPGDEQCTVPVVIDASTYLVGCAAPHGAIYRTTDAGKTWDQVSDKGGLNSPLRASDGAMWWVTPFGQGIVRSEDNGETWEDVKGFQNTGTTPVELPDGRVVIVGQDNLMATSDHGDTWVPVSATLPYKNVTGVLYSKQQKAFFIWHLTCGFEDFVPVPDDAIERFDFDYETQ